MCGFVAFMGKELPTEVDRATVLNRIAHRGPDARGAFAGNGFWLGHTRLAIIDPSPAANQPMKVEPEGPWIVYNGEIYNHRELRTEHRTYRTSSDTETLLYHLRGDGVASLDRFDGIFAFAACGADGVLIAARDRMGVKPLYVSRRIDGVWLASEIKAFPGAVGGAIPESAKMLEYLRYEGIAGPKTLFRGVESLVPGSFLELRNRGADQTSGTFHSPLRDVSREDYTRASAASWDEAVLRLDTLIGRGIEAQMLSDVPIGTLCSGGVDSSLVTAIVHRKDPTVQIFSVDFHEAEYSERRHVEVIASQLGARVHYRVLDRETFLSNLVDCIYHNDHPLSHANSVGIYCVSRMARDHGVKVLLTGEGADELFGGYESYIRLKRRLSWSRRLAWLPDGLRRRIREALNKPVDARDSVLLRSSEGDLSEVAHGHLFRASMRREARAAWGFVADPVEREILATLSSDLTEYLEPILQRQDRMSMMAGVESRVPFLANATVAFAASLPLRFRIRGGEGKALLKDCAEKYLPRSVVRRSKIGFRVPLRAWIQLSSDDLFRGGFLEEEFGSPIHVGQGWIPPSLLFALLNLELWGRIFVRGEDRDVLTERLLRTSAGIAPGVVSALMRARHQAGS